MAFLLGVPAMAFGLITSLGLLQWALILAVASVWFYRRVTSDYGKFEKMGLFGLKPTFLVGNMGPLFRGKVGFLDYLMDQYHAIKEHGIGVIYEASEPIVVVTDPNLMKLIQITDFDHFVDMGFMNASIGEIEANQMGLANSKGEEWRQFKSAVTPAFRLKHMRNISSQFNRSALRMVDHVKAIAARGEEVNFADVTSLFTMDCIASSVMSLDLNVFDNPDHEFVKHGNSLISEGRFFMSMLMPEFLSKFNFSAFNPKSVAFFMNLSKKIISERAGLANPPNDILGIMLKARQNKLEGETNKGADNIYISDQRIAETCMQFFLDGHTTVANVMKMCIYFLAFDEDVQARAQEEIDEFHERHGEDINKDNVAELTYLTQIQDESLRIANFPVASRTVTKPWKVPGRDIVLPVGTRVNCLFGGHLLDPANFPDPYAFDPERFSPENKKSINPTMYQPFGSGPRMCIGMQIAKIESQIFIYHLLRNYTLRPGTKMQGPPMKWSATGIMDPVGGIDVKLTKRNHY